MVCDVFPVSHSAPEIASVHSSSLFGKAQPGCFLDLSWVRVMKQLEIHRSRTAELQNLELGKTGPLPL